MMILIFRLSGGWNHKPVINVPRLSLHCLGLNSILVVGKCLSLHVLGLNSILMVGKRVWHEPFRKYGDVDKPVPNYLW